MNDCVLFIVVFNVMCVLCAHNVHRVGIPGDSYIKMALELIIANVDIFQAWRFLRWLLKPASIDVPRSKRFSAE